MAAADGSIIVDTELDTQGFAAGSREMQRAVRSLGAKVTALGPTMQKAVSGSTAAMSTFESKAAGLEETIGKLEHQLQELGGKRLPTEEYAWLQQQIEKTEATLEKLRAKEDRMSSLGVKENSRQWEALQYDINLASEQLATYKAEMESLESSGSAFQMGSDTQEYANISAALSDARSELSAMIETAQQTDGALRGVAAAGQIVRSAFHGIGSVLRFTASAAVGLLGRMGSAAKSLAIHAKDAASALISMAHSSKKSSGGLSSSLKMLMKYGLGVRSVFALVRRLRSAIKEGFNNLAQYSGTTNAEISALSSSLGALKNGFAAAFAPVLSLVAPVLLTLINLLATAISYVSAFFAALTGGGTFIKAVAVQKDYAAALKKTGGAAGGAAKQAEEAKRQLAGFDELNILNDSNKSSGGGGGAGVDPASMFTTESVPAAVAAYVQALKDAFANGEYEEIGRIIARGLNRGLAAVDGWINESARPAGERWAAIIARGLNGAIDEFDWNLLGVTFGDGLNAVISIGGSFIDKFDWSNLGRKVATLTNGAFRRIDWSAAGRTLSDGVKGVLDYIIAGLENTDWQMIGNSTADFIGAIDWTGITNRLSEGLGAALGGLAAFLWGLIEDAWNETIQWWRDAAYEDGAFTIEGLLDGIKDKLIDIGSWVYDHIFSPFIEGFRSAFGIHSPSTVMAEQGGFIVDGLLKGITDAWGSISSWFTEAWGSVKKTTQDSWRGVKDAVSSGWSKVKETTLDTGSRVKSKVSETWSAVKDHVSDGINAAKDSAKSAWDSIKSKVSSVNSSVSSAVSSAWSSIKTSVSSAASNAGSTVSTKFSSIKSSVSDHVSAAASKVKSGFEGIKRDITDNVSRAMSSVSNSDWRSIGANIVYGLGNGLSNTWYWLRDKAKSLATNLLTSVKSTLGIHSPSRVFRDEVGVFIGEGIGEGVMDSEGSILRSISNVADAIQDELRSGSYTLGAITSGGVESALTNFSDAIVSGFSSLMDRLQAIADSVAFKAPAAAEYGVMPYRASAAAGRGQNIGDVIEAGNDELGSVIIQAVNSATLAIVRAIETNCNTHIDLDADSLAQSTINEINRRTRERGKSPLLA